METLIRRKRHPHRWYPYGIDSYKASIRVPSDTALNKRIRSNFAYSMQWIEYLEKQLSELKLSSVVEKMLYKSYIVTGMGIIESLFVFILRLNNKWKQSEWTEYASTKSNVKSIAGKPTRIDIMLNEQVEKYDLPMDLDSMIKTIEKSNLLTLDHAAYPALKKLRELRNRVHLQIGDSSYDHDYTNFRIDDLQMMRRILYHILTTPEICSRCDYFEFIKKAYTKIQGSD
jgi:hypothetical protein